jgi:oligoendopeptidase F
MYELSDNCKGTASMTTILPQRSVVPTEMTWDLAAIFADDSTWEAECAAVIDPLSELANAQDTLGQSAENLANALSLRDALGQRLRRITAYARLRYDEDTTNVHSQALTDRAALLSTRFAVATAFFIPEILAISPTTLDEWIAQNATLALYRHELEDITRERDHICSAEVEGVLAEAGDFMSGVTRIYSLLTNADLRLPNIVLPDGTTAQLTQGNYGVYMMHPNRDVRRAAFEGLHGTYQKWRNTCGTLYGAYVKQCYFNARQRNYSSTLEASLGSNNIPISVYTNLIAAVNEGLPILHRYLKLRQRALGVEQLHMYDLSAPLVANEEISIGFEEGCNIVLAAMQPLGEMYKDILRRGMTERWIDVLESRGKRSGAYSMGVYGVHPFVLLNYQGRLLDVYTLAHELGHSLHSYLAQRKQPYPYAGYTIFMAEIASTFNEALLTAHLLNSENDATRRAYIITQQLARLYGTLFRQTLFAEFEMHAHAKVEEGGALTPDFLCNLYAELNDRYFGAAGVVQDESIAWEWARIPHFYRGFYVYQYATGVAASTTLSQMVLTEEQPAVTRYLDLLSAGASDYTIPLLQQAGVDMTTPAPVEVTLREFERLVGLLETLI